MIVESRQVSLIAENRKNRYIFGKYFAVKSDWMKVYSCSKSADIFLFSPKVTIIFCAKVLF
jgi:hypothetical protein